jgi:hypothetical protein
MGCTTHALLRLERGYQSIVERILLDSFVKFWISKGNRRVFSLSLPNGSVALEVICCPYLVSISFG